MTARLPLVIGPNGLSEQLQSGDTLPLATTGAFGVVKPDGSTIIVSAGVISASGSASLPWPAHTTENGVIPGFIDNVTPLQTFGAALAAIAPASNSSIGVAGTPAFSQGGPPAGKSFTLSGGTYNAGNGQISITTAFEPVYGFVAGVDEVNLNLAGSAVGPLQGIWPVLSISGGNTVVVLQGPVGQPASTVTGGFLITGGATFDQATSRVTLNTARPGPTNEHNPHRLNNGQMLSFSTTGVLPAPLIPGVRYFIQYGTVDPTSVQLSTTGIFGGTGQVPVLKGTTITFTTVGSGFHDYTVYGEDWAEVIYDPGLYYASNNQTVFGYGLKKLRVLGYGATLMSNTQFGPFNNDINAATGGTTALYSAPFQSTSWLSGTPQNFVTLVSPSDASGFNVNSWVALLCNQLQGSSGFPPNANTFEFQKIRKIDYIGGIVYFFDNLKNNYSATAPLFTLSSAWPGNMTGPAYMYQMNDLFEMWLEYKGFRLISSNANQVSGVLSVKFSDLEVLGFGKFLGPFPSMVRVCIFERMRLSEALPEVDKMIDYLYYDDCDSDSNGGPFFQNASINTTVINRSRFFNIFGTPKNLTLRDSTIADGIAIGPVYGNTEKMVFDNSFIGNITCIRAQFEFVFLDPTYTQFSGGTIFIAPGAIPPVGSLNAIWNSPPVFGVQSDCPLPWAVPGSKAVIFADLTPNGAFAGIGASVKPTDFLGTMMAFTVKDVYVDGSNNYCVDTDLTALPTADIVVNGSLSGTTLTVTSTVPSDAVLIQFMKITATAGGTLPAGTVIASDIGVPNNTGAASDPTAGTYQLSHAAASGSPTAFTASTKMNFLSHPCPRVTTIGCTGGKFVGSQVGAPVDIPLFSYFRQTFATGTIAPQPYFPEAYVSLVGNLKSWTINVVTPYTGVAGSFLLTIYMFGWKKATPPNIYPTYIKQVINLKVAGTRTILPSGSTGAQSGDTLVDCPFWLVGGHLCTLTGSAEALNLQPEIVMIGQADQGIGSALVVTDTATSGGNMLTDTVIGTIL